MAKQFATVDNYVSSFPEDVQTVLQKVRRTIRSATPVAEERISYQIPTLTPGRQVPALLRGMKASHRRLPDPPGDEDFERALAPYRAAKGTVRFPLGKPIPYDLVERLVALQVKQRTAPAS